MSLNKTAARNYALWLVLGLSLVAPVAAATPVKIDNFGKVNDNYYRGGQPKGRDFADLKALGVKLVIDLAEEGDRSEGANVEAAGMKFVRIPLTTGDAPPRAAIDQFLKLVNDPANQPVYVHCMGGRHRTGALTAVYRMTEDGWTADQAFSEMKQYHFGADFLHPELKKFVYTYVSQVDKAPKVLVAVATPAVK
ncbi:MAG TPA: dual specificity protein phosphatase family protein [Vicinamibacterales bacterium]|jgi:protein tyrosine/serine phosphatase|nr:dual specificity protein phosphatase family protein [Vicinamibacterales bacterium]